MSTNTDIRIDIRPPGLDELRDDAFCEPYNYYLTSDSEIPRGQRRFECTTYVIFNTAFGIISALGGWSATTHPHGSGADMAYAFGAMSLAMTTFSVGRYCFQRLRGSPLEGAGCGVRSSLTSVAASVIGITLAATRP